jgi:hypothetical protein
MAFVNEYVPEADIKKYGIEEVDQCYGKSNMRPDWTIDRERYIYLRWMVTGEDEFRNQSDFTFYWKGELIFARLRVTNSKTLGTRAWVNWRLAIMNLPDELQEKKPEIVADLKDALTAYKDCGVYSNLIEHTATFEF